MFKLAGPVCFLMDMLLVYNYYYESFTLRMDISLPYIFLFSSSISRSLYYNIIMWKLPAIFKPLIFVFEVAFYFIVSLVVLSNNSRLGIMNLFNLVDIFGVETI